MVYVLCVHMGRGVVCVCACCLHAVCVCSIERTYTWQVIAGTDAIKIEVQSDICDNI